MGAVFDVQWRGTNDVQNSGVAAIGVGVAGGVDRGEAVDDRFANG